MSEDQALQKAQSNMIAEISPLQAQSFELRIKAELQEVTNDIQLASAVAIKKQITMHRKLVTDTRLGITRRFDDMKKSIMLKEAEVLLPLDEGQTVLGQKILTYTEEQERIKREEQERVDKVISHFPVPNIYQYKTVNDVQIEGERLKRLYIELNPDDQKIAVVKLAFTLAINRLSDRKDYLIEQVRQAEEATRLEAQRVEQSAAQTKIDAEKAANEAMARKIQAEKDHQEREQQRKVDQQAASEAEAERKRVESSQVKTGARTVTTFEITEPDLVPREYCEPVDKLIRAAVTAGKTVPGVATKIERKV